MKRSALDPWANRLGLTLALAVAALLAGLSGCGLDGAPTEPGEAVLLHAPEGQSALTFAVVPSPAAKVTGGNKDDEKAAKKAAKEAKRAAEKAARAAERAAEKAARAAEKAAEGALDDFEDQLEEGLSSDGAVYRAPAGLLSVSGYIGPAGGKLVIEDDPGHSHDRLTVVLQIPEGAVVEPEQIFMAMSGYYLSELVVTFAPPLDFLVDAELLIHVGKNRADVNPKKEDVEAKHTKSDGSSEMLEADANGGRGHSVNIRLFVPGFSVYSLGGGH